MASFDNKSNVDIEMGNNGQLYPGMQENPQMRWAFIRKVYFILCVQFLLMFGVSIAMTLTRPVREFMLTTTGDYVLIATMVVTIILFVMLAFLGENHPWNYVLLLLFTLAMSCLVGVVCSQQKGQTVLVAAGLTLLVTVGLTMFTFFAAKRGWDFNFLGPFLFCALLLLLAFGICRIFFPFGKLGELLIGILGALVFSGYIIYDTGKVIKCFDYDHYIEAAICLFLDVTNLFLSLLGAMGVRD